MKIKTNWEPYYRVIFALGSIETNVDITLTEISFPREQCYTGIEGADTYVSLNEAEKLLLLSLTVSFYSGLQLDENCFFGGLE